MEKKRIHDDVWLEPWTPDWAHEFHLKKQCIIGALIEDGGNVSVRHPAMQAVAVLLIGRADTAVDAASSATAREPLSEKTNIIE